jgi:hypothetical protein
MAVFDTLRLAQRLEGAGLAREKAETFSLALNRVLEDSAKTGVPVQGMTTDQLADLTLEIWRQCECPLRGEGQ